jgi:hypothetical protein
MKNEEFWLPPLAANPQNCEQELSQENVCKKLYFQIEELPQQIFIQVKEYGGVEKTTPPD